MSVVEEIGQAKSATGLFIHVTRSLFGGTREQGLRAGQGRFLAKGWFIGWKFTAAIFCIIWCALLDRQEGIDLGIYLATWTHQIATAYFVISTISSLLCLAYINREKPKKAEEGKPPPVQPVKGTRSPVPCYFRYLQHVSWVLSCVMSMVVMTTFWLTIYDKEVLVDIKYVGATILAGVMLIDQMLIATEYKPKFTWLGVYFFMIYLFYNLAHYYETDADSDTRLSFEVFDWEGDPDKACLWLFLILVFFIPGFSLFHFYVFRFRERMYDSYRHEIVVAPAPEEHPPKEEEEKKEEKKSKKDKKGKDEEDPPQPPAPVTYYVPGPPSHMYPQPGGGVVVAPPPGTVSLSGLPPAAAPDADKKGGELVAIP